MWHEWLLLGGFTWLASLVGTISGFGLSTIMIPVLSLFFPLPVMLLFVGIIHLFGNIWKILLFKKGADWPLILKFGIPGILLSYAGASLSLGVALGDFKKLLGLFLLIYVVYIMARPQWKIPADTRSAVIGGSLSGLFAGLFGVGGAVRGAFLSAFNLPKANYIYTSGLIALFIDFTRLARYVSSGVELTPDLWLKLLILVPLSLLGAWTAKRVVNRVPQKFFRLLIAALLGLVGLKYLLT